MRTSEHECLSALREAADRLGKSPTKSEYEDLGLQPASGTIQRVVGGWNEAKERAGLETYPSHGTRVGPQPDDVSLPDGMTWEELTVDQRWHYRNVEWNTRRTLDRRARLRTWLNDYKSTTGCQHCGVDDAAVLDFHHDDPEEKRMAIGTMVTYGFGRETIREELENCTVLCANCHRKEHLSRSGDTDASGTFTDERAWLDRYKQRAGGCSNCHEDDPRCIDFHHTHGAKRDTVSRLVADGKPKTAVRREIEKCELLCANCHRKEHFEPPQPDEK